MPGFKTHITTSTTLGVLYGFGGYANGIPPTTSILAGGLCSIAGMLPDLDSSSGKPVREIIAFVAAVVPALMIDRFQHLGMDKESMVVAAGFIYVVIRFGIGEIFKRCTVHRGMWHSIPAAAIVGMLAFLVCSCEDMTLRLFKSSAVVLGFMSHLVLDEFFSFEFKRGRLRVKRSLGTALKLFSTRGWWPNISTYGKLVLLGFLAVGDPIFMEHFGIHEDDPHTKPREWFDRIVEKGKELFETKGSSSNHSHPHDHNHTPVSAPAVNQPTIPPAGNPPTPNPITAPRVTTRPGNPAWQPLQPSNALPPTRR